jgi:hypothetical protein
LNGTMRHRVLRIIAICQADQDICIKQDHQRYRSS